MFVMSEKTYVSVGQVELGVVGHLLPPAPLLPGHPQDVPHLLDALVCCKEEHQPGAHDEQPN